MPINPYFSQSIGVNSEQELLTGMVQELSQIKGMDVYYIIRESADQLDRIFGEMPNSKFTKYYTIDMILNNTEAYEGGGDFYSKFGLQINQTTTFTVSARTFEQYVPASVATRPREGDLIYVPVMKKLFEIQFVDEEANFFALGKDAPYWYELRCEMFVYSHEDINTGIDTIDDIEYENSYVVKLQLGSGSGHFNNGEIVFQGSDYANSNASGKVGSWNPANTTLEVYDIKGTFIANANVTGATTNTSYTLTTYDGMQDITHYTRKDNYSYEIEADDILAPNENNPFGYPS